LEQKSNAGNISISVIIPTHNSELSIKSCLDSVNSQSLPRDQYEIIVVDDGSKDKTLDLAKKCMVDNIISINTCSVGTARNIGARSAKGQLLAFLDSDCVAKSNWLQDIYENLLSKDAITGPILNGNPHSLIAWAEYFLEFGGYYEKNSIFPLRFIPGCNQAFKKESFFKTKGFSDEWLAEDVLFGEHLKAQNLEAFFIPQVQIHHLCRTKLDLVLCNMNRLGKYAVRTRRLVKAKYSSLLLRKFFIPLVFLGKIAMSIFYSFKGKKFSKGILSFPYIILASAAFSKGVWTELGKL
jgi:glycosyltransferase involved in cell wall biosynthesis